MGSRSCLTWSEKMRRTTGTTLAPPTRTASEKRENSSPPEGAAAAAVACNPATLVLAAWVAAAAAAGAAAARVWPADGGMPMNPRSPHADGRMPIAPCMVCRLPHGGVHLRWGEGLRTGSKHSPGALECTSLPVVRAAAIGLWTAGRKRRKGEGLKVRRR